MTEYLKNADKLTDLIKSCQKTGRAYEADGKSCILGNWYILGGVRCEFQKRELYGIYTCTKKWK